MRIVETGDKGFFFAVYRMALEIAAVIVIAYVDYLPVFDRQHASAGFGVIEGDYIRVI